MNQDQLLHWVGFKVSKELFVIPIEKVQEIIRLTEISKIPRAPEFIEGIINLRGKVIPIIDMQKRFAMNNDGQERDGRARIVVAEVSGVVAGLIVDDVYEVIRVEERAFEKTPALVSGIGQEFVKGVVKHNNKMFIALDMNKLFSAQEANAVKRVE